MHHPADSAHSFPASDSVTTNAERDPSNHPAQPLLTSGFGAVVEKERDLRAATQGSLGHVSGHRSSDVDRILRHQESRLGTNIRLLEQRSEALPNPERFANWNERHHAPNTELDPKDRDVSQVLPALIARHAALQTDVDALIECTPNVQREELSLREVSRNHEEMAWMLTALLKEDAASVPTNDGSDRASRSTSQAEERWDNEGGPVTDGHGPQLRS